MSAYRKAVTLSLGVISAQVDLHNAIPSSSDRSTKMLCPTHFQPIQQEYRCSADPAATHVVARAEAVKGVANAKGWTILEGTKEAAKTGPVDLTPVALSVLTEQTFEGGSVYYLIPTSVAFAQAHQVLINILRKGKLALVAKTALGAAGKDKLWRLELFRGSLVMRELVYPEAIKDAPNVEPVKVDKAITTLVDQFVDGLTADWDSIDTSDSNVRRFDEWVKAGKTIEIDTPVVETNTSPIDLINALQEAVAQKASKKK